MREVGRAPRIIIPILLGILALGVAGRYKFAQQHAQGQAAPAGSHSVHLSWAPSPSKGTTGYNVYRSNASRVDYVKINTKPLTDLNYVDPTVVNGHTYYYAVTAVDGKGNESTYSKEFVIKVP